MKIQGVNTLVFSSFGYSVNTLQVRILGSAEMFWCKHFSLNKTGSCKVIEVLGVMFYNYEGIWMC